MSTLIILAPCVAGLVIALMHYCATSGRKFIDNSKTNCHE